MDRNYLITNKSNNSDIVFDILNTNKCYDEETKIVKFNNFTIGRNYLVDHEKNNIDFEAYNIFEDDKYIYMYDFDVDFIYDGFYDEYDFESDGLSYYGNFILNNLFKLYSLNDKTYLNFAKVMYEYYNEYLFKYLNIHFDKTYMFMIYDKLNNKFYVANYDDDYDSRFYGVYYGYYNNNNIYFSNDKECILKLCNKCYKMDDHTYYDGNEFKKLIK